MSVKTVSTPRRKAWKGSSLLCLMSESPSGKRKDLHDNATHKGREIYCWLESGPLLQPTQWCKVREPWAPVSTHIYRVLDFKHKQLVVSPSGLVTCLQRNFIGQTHFKLPRARDFPGDSSGGLLGTCWLASFWWPVGGGGESPHP